MATTHYCKGAATFPRICQLLQVLYLNFTVAVPLTSAGIRAVLSQCHDTPPKLFPCSYFSRKLCATEQNYDIRNRELLAMKAVFKEWHHYLLGAKHPFLVLMDHRNLEYLCAIKRLNPRQARWALFFTHFHFSHLPPWFKEYQSLCPFTPT